MHFSLTPVRHWNLFQIHLEILKFFSQLKPNTSSQIPHANAGCKAEGFIGRLPFTVLSARGGLPAWKNPAPKIYIHMQIRQITREKLNWRSRSRLILVDAQNFSFINFIEIASWKLHSFPEAGSRPKHLLHVVRFYCASSRFLQRASSWGLSTNLV